jgi:hypothetical protein
MLSPIPASGSVRNQPLPAALSTKVLRFQPYGYLLHFPPKLCAFNPATLRVLAAVRVRDSPPAVWKASVDVDGFLPLGLARHPCCVVLVTAVLFVEFAQGGFNLQPTKVLLEAEPTKERYHVGNQVSIVNLND